LLLLCAAFVVGQWISDRQRVKSIATAQGIIDAAERFRATTGAYPQSLGSLVPAYLAEVPRTDMGFGGRRYRYFAEPEEFHLSFELPAWLICSFSSRSKQWYIHD
jgi:hypothetical protein